MKYLEILNHLLVLVIHNMNVSIVQSTQHPWLRWVEIH
jgi:tRNA threonylcarbamoyladenosine modification (KEOPS) complex  Pcc1 subunit